MVLDAAFHTIESPNDCLKGGTFRELFQEGMSPNGRILNIMDISLGSMGPRSIDDAQFKYGYLS